MKELVVRLVQGERELGEWPVSNVPISIGLHDAETGDCIASFALTGAPHASLHEEIPAGSVAAEEPPEVTEQDEESRTDRIEDHDLADIDGDVDPEDFEEGDTVVAPLLSSPLGSQGEDARAAFSAADGGAGSRESALEQEPAASLPGRAPAPPPPAPEDAADPGAERGEYDEVPVRGDSRREPGDDVSLSFATSQEEELSRYPGDDFTMPLPEDEEESSDLDLEEVYEEESPPARPSAEVTRSPNSGGVQPRVASAGTHGRRNVYGGQGGDAAEVWFRQGGEWIPKGTLTTNQEVKALGGVIRCDGQGGLVVSSGPHLSGSATLPSGDLVPVDTGQSGLYFQPGTSVILWAGDLGFYVRSNLVPEFEPASADEPVEYRKTPHPQTWEAPRSDLDGEGKS